MRGWSQYHPNISRARNRSPFLNGIDRWRAYEGPKCLFVGNLPFSCSIEDLLKIFQRYGRLSEVFLPLFPGTGKSHGFAFIKFMYEDDARAAKGVLNGKCVDGRKDTVEDARPRKGKKVDVPQSIFPQKPDSMSFSFPATDPPNHKGWEVPNLHQSTSSHRSFIADSSEVACKLKAHETPSPPPEVSHLNPCIAPTGGTLAIIPLSKVVTTPAVDDNQEDVVEQNPVSLLSTALSTDTSRGQPGYNSASVQVPASPLATFHQPGMDLHFVPGATANHLSTKSGLLDCGPSAISPEADFSNTHPLCV
ncbi:uncharacterized protein LOC131234580 [Magnolia sinica]|uniref:uncharacterized protein LOC131234580 n=1 Tax=Magnolia sinica TaxID=86752 RepID=UPI002658813A|nr:uncharacterized protein LOC131234580 [Magnolia sinica]